MSDLPSGGELRPGVPGNPIWHLAPREMAWEGKTIGEICAQIKDPARNGNRSLASLVEHIGEDHLVGWAWAPGAGRKPAPGTQKQAGALVEAWVTEWVGVPETMRFNGGPSSAPLGWL